MKDKLKQELERELGGVHVSGNLKRRILTEAAASRAPERKRHARIAPLAAAAAVVLVVGLTAGVLTLRAEKPDLSATPLSAAKVKTVQELVWVRLPDGIYHALSDCSEVRDPISMQLDTARASGMKGCSNCIESGSAIAEDLVWMTNYGNYYHAVKDCSGMTGAVGMLEVEAKTLGRQACSVCFGGETIFDPSVANTPEPSMIAVPLEENSADAQPIAATAEPTLTPRSFVVELPEATWSPATAEPSLPPTTTLTPWPTTALTPRPTPAPTAEPEAEEVVLPTAAPLATEEPAEWEMTTPVATVELPEEPMNVSAGDASAAVIIDGGTEQMYVWMTDGGVYYHSDEYCSGMSGAYGCEEHEAANAGKEPCPVCLAESENEAVYDAEEASVWMTDGGVYYHVDEHCSGMNGAHVCGETEAIKNGKLACPVCLADMDYEAYGQEKVAVWMTDGGVYYHIEEHCSGMENAVSRVVTEALGAGKLPCPQCAKQFGSVWATENGKYYHLDSECSGMTEPVEMTWAQADAQGKELCPVCHEQLIHTVNESMTDGHTEEVEHHSESEVQH